MLLQPLCLQSSSQPWTSNNSPQTKPTPQRSSPTEPLSLEDIPFGNFTVLCDTSTGSYFPVVPAKWTYKVFKAIHKLSHAGCRPNQHAVSEIFVWQHMRPDIQQLFQSCHPCQASKIHCHVRAPIASRQLPNRRFGRIYGCYAELLMG